MTPGKREALNGDLTPRSASLPSWVLVLDGETTLASRSYPSRYLSEAHPSRSHPRSSGYASRRRPSHLGANLNRRIVREPESAGTKTAEGYSP